MQVDDFVKFDIYEKLYLILSKELNDVYNLIKLVLNTGSEDAVHDFRVHLRKLRTLLNNTKRLSIGEDTAQFSIKLKEIMSSSNLLRDYDVLLLKLEKIEKQNSSNIFLIEILTSVKEYFYTLRINEMELLNKKLKSRLLRSELHKLRLFIKTLKPKESDINFEEFSSKIIEKRYKTIAKSCKRFHELTDNEIHSIRIILKKYRYSIDNFGKLIDNNKSGRIIRELKNIQDLFGRYNDVCIQQHTISKLSNDLGSLSNMSKSFLIGLLWINQYLSEEKSEIKNNLSKFFNNYKKYAEYLSFQ